MLLDFSLVIPCTILLLCFSMRVSSKVSVNLLQECITSQGYDFLRIDGTTKSCDRIKIVDVSILHIQ